MKTSLLPMLVLVAAISTASAAYDSYVMVPRDFSRSLANHSEGNLQPLDYTGVYENSVGVVVNQNVRTRDKLVRVATQKVSPALQQLFGNSRGQELVSLAADLAKKTPDRAVEIASAALRRNIETGGSPQVDVAIVHAIFDALGSAIPVKAAATLIGLGTERLPQEKLDATVREWRANYLSHFERERFGDVAKRLDTQLVRTQIALAYTLSPQEYAALRAGLGDTQQPTEGSTTGTPVDTNPFFSGIPGVNNISSGGGGGGGGGGSSSPSNPNPPAS